MHKLLNSFLTVNEKESSIENLAGYVHVVFAFQTRSQLKYKQTENKEHFNHFHHATL